MLFLCRTVLFSNIHRKINFMAKKLSDPCNFYSKLDFSIYLFIYYYYYFFFFLLFFTDFKLLGFHNYASVKVSEILNKCNLLKICIQTSYPIDVVMANGFAPV